jgi:hypothetical protein
LEEELQARDGCALTDEEFRDSIVKSHGVGKGLKQGVASKKMGR